MKHPNAPLIEKLYTDFSQGNIAALLSQCSDAITFQVPGKSKLAGKYTAANFETGYVNQLRELSGNTFKIEVHDVLASDQHATVLVTEKLVRNGKPIEFRAVHVWRLEAGKPVAWYEYPRDLYAFDAIWV